ncbi:MAG: AMP-binding protein, partial [Paracoccaceae bacterium]
MTDANLYTKFANRFPQDAENTRFAELEDGRFYLYSDIDKVTARMAATLSGLGVMPGDRVAAQVEKSMEAFMLYLAVVRAGAVFLPLNTAYTPAEIAYFLGDAEPRVFFCDLGKAEGLAPVAAKAAARLATLGAW